jgi:hypothetical protein
MKVKICIFRTSHGDVFVSHSAYKTCGFSAAEAPSWKQRLFNFLCRPFQPSKKYLSLNCICMKAAHNSGIVGYLKNWPKDDKTTIDVFGELICNNSRLDVLVLRVVMDNVEQPYGTWFTGWAPEEYIGKVQK